MKFRVGSTGVGRPMGGCHGWGTYLIPIHRPPKTMVVPHRVGKRKYRKTKKR